MQTNLVRDENSALVALSDGAKAAERRFERGALQFVLRALFVRPIEERAHPVDDDEANLPRRGGSDDCR